MLLPTLTVRCRASLRYLPATAAAFCVSTFPTFCPAYPRGTAASSPAGVVTTQQQLAYAAGARGAVSRRAGFFPAPARRDARVLAVRTLALYCHHAADMLLADSSPVRTAHSVYRLPVPLNVYDFPRLISMDAYICRVIAAPYRGYGALRRWWWLVGVWYGTTAVGVDARRLLGRFASCFRLLLDGE